MDTSNWQTVEKIIDEVLELPKEKREDFIEERCRNNHELKNEVTLLLTSITESEGWLEHPENYKNELFSDDLGNDNLIAVNDDLIDSRVGSYQIKEEVGVGGMGKVFRADHVDEEINQQVAVKILNIRRASASIIKRFQREQRLLAKLNHPNIARFYDAGVTQNGAPYIIMEYVEGTPIHQYCDESGCTIQEKIGLFKEVLKGVRYAHENLIIHRDLKPANILVTNTGKVKILDFGISKLLDEDAPSDLTQKGSRLLTPKYAAPEQILEHNITTATDTYSLGVLFFYLLTKNYPYHLENLSHYEMEQAILKNAPQKPSESVKNQHLQKELRGDLDAILLKSIRKENDYRYRTANEFLEDLEHFQQNLPVSAQEGSRSYRLQKFIKRNQKNVSFAAASFLLLLMLGSFFTWRIAQERNQAEMEAQKAENVKNLLTGIFEASDPISNGNDDEASLNSLLEAGTEKVRSGDMAPAVKIELLLTLSTIYQNITEFEKAENLASESLNLSIASLGPNSIEAAQSYMQLAGISFDLGEYAESKQTLRKSEQIILNTASSGKLLQAELYEHLGYTEESLGNYDSSQTYFNRSLAILENKFVPDSALYISVLRSSARAYYRYDENEKGDSLMLKALEITKQHNGQNDIVTGSILGDLGMYSMTRAKYKKARSYFNQSLDIKGKVYADGEHPKYTATLMNLGVLEETLGNYQRAESLFIQTIELDTKIYGPDHPYVAMSKSYLGSINNHLGNYEKAKQFYAETMDNYLESYGEGHSYLSGTYKGYAHSLSELGKFEKADEYFEKALQIYDNQETSSHALYAKLYEVMGKHNQKKQDHRSAIEYLSKCANLFYSTIYDEYKIRAAKCQLNQIDSHLALSQKDKALLTLANLKTNIDTTTVLSKNEDVLLMMEKAESSLK